MNRQEFREKLSKNLTEVLQQRLQQYFDRRFESYGQIVRYISALDRKYEDKAIVRKGLPSILGAIAKELDKEQDEKLSVVYESAVGELLQSFPAQVEWIQNEERFVVQGDDSFSISIGKRVKKNVRSILQSWHNVKTKTISLFGGSPDQRERWLQTIPMQNVLRYHMFNPDVVEQWSHHLERVQLDIIMDIEALLVSELENSSDEESEIYLVDFADSLGQKVSEKRQIIKEKISENIHALESEIVKIIDKVDTLEKSNGFYSNSRVKDRQDRASHRLQLNREAWKEVHYLFHVRTKLMHEFLILQSDINQRCSEFLDDLEGYFNEVLKQPLRELHEMLEKGNQKSSTGEIQLLKEQLTEHLNERMINPVKQALDQQVFSQKMEHLFEKLLVRANQVSQEGVILHDMNVDENPPQIDHRTIEWRLLVVRCVREQLVSEVQPVQQQFSEFLSKLLEEFHEILSIIDVSLESALAVEDDRKAEQGEDATEVATEALQRLMAAVDSLQKKLGEKHQQVASVIKEGDQLFGRRLQALVHEGDVKELQLLNAKYKAKETTKNWQSLFLSRIARVQDRLALWGRFGWQKLKALAYTSGTFLGLREKKMEETKRADIATYLSETDQKMRELPYIYRRLFNFDAVADQRFYVPVLESTGIFRKAYEQWQDSFPSTLAVVGEKGSGKSTFLNLTLQSELVESKPVQIEIRDTIWSEQHLVHLFCDKLDISGAESVQDIINAINNWNSRKVINIESIQNCFVRNLNGYEAIEKLCYLISETKRQVFWVVSCSRYAWRFLDKTVQLSEYFTHLTTTDVLNADEIKKVILNRHRSSGYTLHFEASSDMLKSRSYRRLMDQEEKAQEYLQENYFKKLTELAEGNASVAMIFWIRSIREFDDTYCYVRPLEFTSVEMIEDLGSQVLFNLAAFVLHDTLTDVQLSMVMDRTKEESRLMLNRLESRGLLVEKEGAYAINHLMYRQIVRVLKECNIIHLV